MAQLDDLYLRLERSGLAPSAVRRVHAVVSGALKQAVNGSGSATTGPATPASRPPAGTVSCPLTRLGMSTWTGLTVLA